MGYFGWGDGASPSLAAFLPALIVCVGSRSLAFLAGALYSAMVLRHTGEFIGGWFGASAVVGWVAVAAYSLIAGAIWSLGSSQSRSPARRATAAVLALVTSLLPPFALAIPGHPLVGVGYLAPASGAAGIAGLLALTGAWAALNARMRDPFALAPCMVVVVAFATAQQTPVQPELETEGLRAISPQQTNWGALRGPEDALERITAMGVVTAKAGQGSTLVWPESVLGVVDTPLGRVLELEVRGPSKRKAVTQIIGMDHAEPTGGYRSMALVLHPHGRDEAVYARQPAPVSLWRPWSPKESFHADWSPANTVRLRDGSTIALIFCYEEYIPALFLLSAARDPVDVFVVLTNTWAAIDRRAATVQDQHSRGMVALLGRAIFKAENAPAP